MGMSAYVLCIGEFSEKVRDCLLYDAGFYEDTKPGTVVIARKLHCNTTDQSRDLAEALGCDVWDFNTHRLHTTNINWVSLYYMADAYAWDDGLDVGRLDKLIEANFMCIFMPNG